MLHFSSAFVSRRIEYLYPWIPCLNGHKEEFEYYKCDRTIDFMMMSSD